MCWFTESIRSITSVATIPLCLVTYSRHLDCILPCSCSILLIEFQGSSTARHGWYDIICCEANAWRPGLVLVGCQVASRIRSKRALSPHQKIGSHERVSSGGPSSTRSPLGGCKRWSWEAGERWQQHRQRTRRMQPIVMTCSVSNRGARQLY